MPADGRDSDHFRFAIPAFIGASRKLTGALELASALRLAAPDGRVGHALRVATLMHQAGYEEDVVAASLLQAVADGTTKDVERIRVACGDDVGDLVSVLVDEPSNGSYEQRLAAQRVRVARSDRIAAAIFAADQLTRIRAIAAAGLRPTGVEFRHYRRTVTALARAFPELPFIAEIRFELGGFVGGRWARPKRG